MDESRRSVRWMRRFALLAAIQGAGLVKHPSHLAASDPAIVPAERSAAKPRAFVRLPSAAAESHTVADEAVIRLPKVTGDLAVKRSAASIQAPPNAAPRKPGNVAPLRLPGVSPAPVSYRASHENEVTPIEIIPQPPTGPTTPVVRPTIHETKLREMAHQSLRDAHGRLRREATYSAQKIATEALRLLVAISDSREGGTQHATELESAIVAIRESADFWGPQGPIDQATLKRSIAIHQTDISGVLSLENASNLQATSMYLDYARNQLVRAAGSVTDVSDALVLLGTIEKQIADAPSPHASAVALTMQRAAVEINPTSGYCRRELGKTLLDQGLVSEAIHELRHSVALQPTQGGFEALRLAAIQVNDFELAAHCETELRHHSWPSELSVHQLPPEQFAMTHRPSAVELNQSLNSSRDAISAETVQASEKRSWFPFSRR